VTIVALLVIMIGGYAIVQALKKTPSAIISGTRAVVVPTNDALRTVIVTPCGTGSNVLTTDLNVLRHETGTTTFELPKGEGVRSVLVPACTAGKSGTAGTTQLPGGAFVPAAGQQLPPIGTGKTTTTPVAGSLASAQYEVTVPNGSPITTVVVGPCEKIKSSTPAQQILIPSGNSSVAVAPPC
jgi:hypothetical protein